MEEPDVEVRSTADPDLVDEVAVLVDRVGRSRGTEGLSEARQRALAAATTGDGGRFVAVAARASVGGPLVGYAQVDGEGDRSASSAELLVATSDGAGGTLADRLLDAALSAFAADGGAASISGSPTPTMRMMSVLRQGDSRSNATCCNSAVHFPCLPARAIGRRHPPGHSG